MDFGSHVPNAIASIDDNVPDPISTKKRVIEILDRLENRVERLRQEASKLEEERDAVLATLDSVRDADLMNELMESEREETNQLLDRIIDRCLTIDVKVHVQRDTEQEESLHQVNHLIDALVMNLKSDPDGTKAKCISYMNACASQYVHGITDKKFECALLGCTLDDQKRVKKRLQGLLDYIDKLNVSTEIQA